MKILIWHVHGGWMEAFVRGSHTLVLPTTPERDGFGLGRGGRDWPRTAIEVPPRAIAEADVDAVVLQRPQELKLAEQLTRRQVGHDLPAVYVEHNTPPNPTSSVHPLADRDDIVIAHVTAFNALVWDCGSAPTTVIEHGVPDPGPRYTGAQERLATLVNDPIRRSRVVGTDLLPRFAAAAPIDAWGMGTEQLRLHRVTGHGDMPFSRAHAEMAARRAYVHPARWTSLGLSLIEAMHLAMPVLALATTEAVRAVPPEAGAISTDVDELVAVARLLLADPDEARIRGRIARDVALAWYGLDRFLEDWNGLLADVVERRPHRAAGARRSVLRGAR